MLALCYPAFVSGFALENAELEGKEATRTVSLYASRISKNKQMTNNELLEA